MELRKSATWCVGIEHATTENREHLRQANSPSVENFDEFFHRHLSIAITVDLFEDSLSSTPSEPEINIDKENFINYYLVRLVDLFFVEVFDGQFLNEHIFQWS